jgi:hypothetical protein
MCFCFRVKRKMLAIGRKLYKPWVLLLVTCGYIVAELGHFLIGVTSRATARDLHYGDHACQLNVTVSTLKRNAINLYLIITKI